MKRTLVAIAALSLTTVCQAQEARFFVSPFWGYRFGGDVMNTAEASPPRKISVADHSSYGVRIDYAISPKVAAELEASRFDSHLIDSETPAQFRFRDDTYLALGKVTFSGLPVTPYAALGGGVSRLDTTFADTFSGATHDYFSAALAAGLDWFFASHVGIRAEGRLYATDIHGDPIGFPCTAFVPDSNGAIVPVECPRKNWLLNEEASLGLVVRF